MSDPDVTAVEAEPAAPLDLEPLHNLPQLAAQGLGDKGWTQGTEQDSHGRMCLTGALRICAPIPGDGHIAREVFRRRNRAESWNDENGRSAEEVITYLAATEITDEELAETFGPQWREIVAQVRAISGATPKQIEDLAAARVAARAAAWAAAWDAAWDAARDAAWAAAWAAARALVVRDLIGQHGFEQHHYDTLTKPWRSVMGPLHPDDAPVES